MRKTLIVIIVLSLIISGFTIVHGEEYIPEYTENFSYRNGIVFGDTMDAIISKETHELNTIDREKGNIKTSQFNLMNIKDSYIQYYFGYSKNKLEKITYHFGQADSIWIAFPEYDIINSDLIEKYGEPLGYENGDHYKVWNGVLQSSSFAVDMFKVMGVYAELIDYDEWVLKYPDYSVKIEHAYYAYRNEMNKTVYSHGLSFARFEE